GAACPGAPASPFTLVFLNPEVVSSAVLARDPLRLAEAYFRGDLDIEGDFFAALHLKNHLQDMQMSVGERIGAAAAAVRLRKLNAGRHGALSRWTPSHGLAVKAHSKEENRDAIHFHYDVSNDFYALWLDRAMVYSCAYFETSEADLDAAQHAKLEHICRKLSLKRGDLFLDIGCGWGALVMHAAKHYGVTAYGVTLSQQQLKLARERIAAAGLADKVSVELQDYRDIPGDAVYDKIASVGMFEHVGLKNLPAYFGKVQRLLKPHGLFLNHGITHDGEGWQNSMSTEFINRYVFPDGQLDNISNIQHLMEGEKFEIADVEALRPHYALTLRHWVARLEGHHERALQFVNEATYRVWRLYMTACALDFEEGGIGIYQVLAAKRAAGNLPVPLTRKYMYL
ncbi:MAG: cyclopropane-fatty-acyl-phospholipid synthase family protein, partial [Gammaproteobacteria bacterium]